MTVRKLALGVVATAVFATAATAQQQGPPPMPKPGPEHKILAMDVGTWDAVMEMPAAPGAPPMTSKGVEVNTIGCGGLCLITDFKGDLMPGVTFQGHGITTWDAAKKKYVGSWMDSMSAGISRGESTYDAASKKFTGWIEGPDTSGKVSKMKTTVEYPAPGTRVMTMWEAASDAKETQTLKITYKKR